MRGASAASLMEWDGVGTLALSTCLPGYDDESIVTIVCGWRERGRACGYGACGPPSRAGRVEDGVNMMASSPRHGGSISAATRVGVVELHAPCARAAGSRPVLPRSRGFSAETGQRHRQRQRTEGVRPRGASPRSLGVYLYGQNLFHLVWIRLAFEFPVSWILLFWGLGGAPSASRALCACAPCPETRQTHTLTQTVSHGRAALEHPTAHGRAAADASQSSKDVVTTAARAPLRDGADAQNTPRALARRLPTTTQGQRIQTLITASSFP